MSTLRLRLGFALRALRPTTKRQLRAENERLSQDNAELLRLANLTVGCADTLVTVAERLDVLKRRP